MDGVPGKDRATMSLGQPGREMYGGVFERLRTDLTFNGAQLKRVTGTKRLLVAPHMTSLSRSCFPPSLPLPSTLPSFLSVSFYSFSRFRVCFRRAESQCVPPLPSSPSFFLSPFSSSSFLCATSIFPYSTLVRVTNTVLKKIK